MRPLVLSRASDSAPRTWNGTAAALRSLYHFNSSSKSRKRSSRRGVACRRNEESCASLPAYFSMRDRSTTKAAGLRLAVQMASKVSSAATVRLPFAFLHITRHPVLFTCVRIRGGKASRCAFDSSGSAKLPKHEGSRAQRGLAAHKPQHGSASRAASRLMVLYGRRAAWSGSWPRWSAPCMPSAQTTRTATLPPLLGRAGDSFIPFYACMHGRRVRNRIESSP